ncbi:hypothetical protein Trydic_g476 [Trypoxylus dichotomus]
MRQICRKNDPAYKREPMEAYRRWVCSSLVPNFVGPDLRVRPCLSVCQNVEQQCPYMLPGDRAPAHPTQYAGEPTFLCLDPNIPETGEQRTKSSVGDEDCCYTHCGSPGRGLCVNCSSGRPSNGTREPVPCAVATATKTSGCGKSGTPSSGAASRTHYNKVQLQFPLWTAWIHLMANTTACSVVSTSFTPVVLRKADVISSTTVS